MRKRVPLAERPVVPKEMLELAKLASQSDQLRRPVKCSVCGSENVAPNSEEGLCWVCRRLKISAWRDNDLQANAPQE